jgi:hypothetical protein
MQPSRIPRIHIPRLHPPTVNSFSERASAELHLVDVLFSFSFPFSNDCEQLRSEENQVQTSGIVLTPLSGMGRRSRRTLRNRAASDVVCEEAGQSRWLLGLCDLTDLISTFQLGAIDVSSSRILGDLGRHMTQSIN